MVRRFSSECALFITFFQLGSRLSLHCSLQLGLSFVIHLLTACHSNFNFDPSVFEVELCGNESHSLFGRGFVQSGYFTFVKQQLASPQWIVVLAIAMRIRRNMSIKQPRLPLAH